MEGGTKSSADALRYKQKTTRLLNRRRGQIRERDGPWGDGDGWEWRRGGVKFSSGI
jgi:hypothetical protein